MDARQVRRFSIFSGLTSRQQDAVAACAETRVFEAAQRLFAAGDPADSFYLISRGAVRFEVPGAGGAVGRTLHLRAGAFFGEIGLVRECPRTASAFVDAGTTLLRFDRDTFFTLLEGQPDLARKVAVAIKDRLGEWESDAEAKREAAARPRVLAFYSTVTPAPASFIAANMAALLAEDAGGPVLALDLREGGEGLADFLTPERTRGGLGPVFETAEVTDMVLKRCVYPLESGVHLIGADPAALPESLRPRHLAELIAAAREQFSYVVITPGVARDELREEVARACDIAHLVCGPSERSVGFSDLHAQWLREAGLEGRVRFVLDRVRDRPEVAPDDLAKILGENLLGTIHYSAEQAVLGEKAGKPLVSARPESEVAGQLRLLCRAVKNQPLGPVEKIARLVRWTLGLK